LPITLIGDELGPYSNTSHLRRIAREYGRAHLVGQSVVNLASGLPISITTTGLKHTLSGAWDDLAKTVFVLPDILRDAELNAVLPDSKGRPEIMRIYRLQVPVVLAGTMLQVGVTVREASNGDVLYYHHAIIRT
jgi:hypothetical protein